MTTSIIQGSLSRISQSPLLRHAREKLWNIQPESYDFRITISRLNGSQMSSSALANLPMLEQCCHPTNSIHIQ